MIRLHAEHDGDEEDTPLGQFTDLRDAAEFIQEQNDEDLYWMEGCDLVATDDLTGEVWYFVDDGWEPY